MDFQHGEPVTTVRSTIQGLVVETRVSITSWELNHPVQDLALADLLDPTRLVTRKAGEIPMQMSPSARLAHTYDQIVSRQVSDIEDTLSEMRRLSADQVVARMIKPAEVQV